MAQMRFDCLTSAEGLSMASVVASRLLRLAGLVIQHAASMGGADGTVFGLEDGRSVTEPACLGVALRFGDHQLRVDISPADIEGYSNATRAH